MSLTDSFVSRLMAEMDRLVPLSLYPTGVRALPATRIRGTAFSPGGSGLYSEDRDLHSLRFPLDGVMVLGHNFDSEKGFKISVGNGKENVAKSTWRPLLNLLPNAGIPLDRCFFTNAFMGLCEGEDSLDYRGRDDAVFRAACIAFLRAQIAIQRPQLIITLGCFVPSMVAALVPGLTSWTAIL